MKKLTTTILILAALLVPCLSRAAADSWDLRLPADLTEIEEAAFEGDTKLNCVYVGDGVETIGPRAFANSSLRDIRLPESLTEFAPDAFLGIPHVEVYGTWNDDFFAGMDNVAMSGAELPSNTTSYVPVAPGQSVLRSIPVTAGQWYFGVENCTAAELYTEDGEKIVDLTFGTSAYFVSYPFPEDANVLLCIHNDTDALVDTQVYIESPFNLTAYIGKYQAEYKGGSLLLELNNVNESYSLLDVDAHHYYAPAFQLTVNGKDIPYQFELFVDNIPVKRWEGTISTTTTAENFLLEPVDVMKFGGFDEGDHTVRLVANDSVIEFSYTLADTRQFQNIGQTASSLYILPGQHAFACFTAESDGVYTIQSDSPAPLQLYGCLFDEDGNVLDCKVEDTESYDFTLSASLAKGESVWLEAWFASQEDTVKPFYGVVTLIVNDPSAQGADIFQNATCRALVIGETYETAPENITRLDGCKNDAKCMVKMLQSLAGTPYTVSGYLDLDAAEILDAISEAFAGATEDDVSLFYYSGHGVTGSGALLGNDGVGVSPETLRKKLDQVPGTKIILLDSCFSGYLIGRGSDEAANAKAALEHFLSVFSWSSRGDGSEYYVLTASSLYETSIGYVGATSLFTGNLLEGMGYDPEDASRTGSCPADANQDGMFTLDELFVYCRTEIRSTKLGQTVCPWPYNCSQVLFIDEVPEQ